ncbi:hypothetical protein Pmani_009545 [Petrolisthes manimaculis]|uniref:Uncharacterized protein n=1 Tax=Petrolisthes manimaculis TaxID=1843537 RepID=A0AAE1Q3A4_9EUCA|nr:hypothetical protein Pmani_009545 [Petrolisthes manimaculis]
MSSRCKLLILTHLISPRDAAKRVTAASLRWITCGETEWKGRDGVKSGVGGSDGVESGVGDSDGMESGVRGSDGVELRVGGSDGVRVLSSLSSCLASTHLTAGGVSGGGGGGGGVGGGGEAWLQVDL